MFKFQSFVPRMRKWVTRREGGTREQGGLESRRQGTAKASEMKRLLVREIR